MIHCDKCTFILGFHDRWNGQKPPDYAQVCGRPADDPIHDVTASVSVYREEMLATGSNYDSRGNVWDVNDHNPGHTHFFEPAAEHHPKTDEESK
jgi:hypothetical protein